MQPTACIGVNVVSGMCRHYFVCVIVVVSLFVVFCCVIVVELNLKLKFGGRCNQHSTSASLSTVESAVVVVVVVLLLMCYCCLLLLVAGATNTLDRRHCRQWNLQSDLLRRLQSDPKWHVGRTTSHMSEKSF